METLKKLAAAGWFAKLMIDQQEPKPLWRVWVRWPYGPLPHKEESDKFRTIKEAIDWLNKTTEDWRYGDDS